MIAKTVHFTIDFDWLTRHIRELWAEHSFDKAYKVLQSSGAPKDYHDDIIRGVRKIAQDPKGKPGVDARVYKDKWKPDLSLCQCGEYPDPSELAKLAGETITLKNRKIDEQKQQARELVDRIKYYLGKYDTYAAASLIDAFESLPKEITNDIDMPFNRDFIKALADPDQQSRAKKVINQLGKNTKTGKVDDIDNDNSHWPAVLHEGVPDVDSYLTWQNELDKRATPKPTTTYKADNAWLAPDGKFYPLRAMMEHIWLASRLGETELSLEDKGWVKITKSLTGRYLYCKNAPTQSQINVAWDWAKDDTSRESVMEEWLDLKRV